MLMSMLFRLKPRDRSNEKEAQEKSKESKLNQVKDLQVSLTSKS